MTNIQQEVIDLTTSFILEHDCTMANIVIDLGSDESLNLSFAINSDKKKPKERRTQNPSDSSKTTRKRTLKAIENNEPKPAKKQASNKIGSCPICLEELGINPLAATKCGHVFCQECLEETIKIKKQCPTCRVSLRGKSAYHPLYLSHD